VRKRTDGAERKMQAASPDIRPEDSMSASTSAAPPPLEVFYVVQSMGTLGERDHRLRSALFESRPQAEVELARLRTDESAGSYGVWKSTTYIEPAEWLHRVVRSDGTLILPRLHGMEKCADAPMQ
jgi:hypothetical protein